MTKLSLACGLTLSVALAACSSVPKAAPAATAAPAASTTASTTPKVVCEDTAQMGTHMQSHICLTPEQMTQRHKESQLVIQELQSRANTNAPATTAKPPV